ncbi:dienelactone hydrolase family protein [Lentisalinibacter sediminis]|uniref:dienelactone hydrolase family protein n=1 Tax=Lentisalinibacter sediminis TaxID=2992237 RepID=UPI0038709A53
MNIVVFHSALGVRPAVLDLAEKLREQGHCVYTPDLFDGHSFDDLADGVRYRDAIGIEELLGRAASALDPVGGPMVLAGVSMGCGAAQMLAVERDDVRGLVLMHGALAPEAIGVDRWPGVPVQVHYAPRDSWVDEDQVLALRRRVIESETPCELFRYPVEGHLFEDPTSGCYSEELTEKMHTRVADFVKSVSDRGVINPRPFQLQSAISRNVS